jgi:TonB-linked SusC/RagA family outer membrane protein
MRKINLSLLKRVTNHGKQLLGVWALLFVSTAAMAQYSFKGKIVDELGQPVVGATVLVKGAGAGTSAGVDGTYSFSGSMAQGSYTLVASALGYKSVEKKVALGNQTSVTTDFTMAEDATNLDEIVVIGSTVSQSRRQLGNAITVIKSDQLQKTGTDNLMGALQGKAMGAQITQNSGDPGGAFSIRLRGIKSLSGSSDPLYVIDGVVMSNATDNVANRATSGVRSATQGSNRLADLNPSDIESINVLNGAAAAAQYGSRASNGVVIINTKRGKSGAPEVTFTTSYTSSELRKGVQITTLGKQFGTNNLRLHTLNNFVTATSPFPTTSIVRDGSTIFLASGLVDVQRYNYFDYIFRNASGTDNTISVSGGNEKTRYFVSASYMSNQGIIRGTDFTRYGIRANIDQQLNNWAKLSVGLSYNNSFENMKPNGNSFLSPINSVNITNNIWNPVARDAAGNLPGVEPSRINPVSVVEQFDFNQRVNRTINNVRLTLTPIKGLTIDGVVGVDAYSQIGQNLIPPYPYAASSALPAGLFPTGFAASGSLNNVQYNADLNVTYEKELTNDIKLTATAGYNFQSLRKDFSVAAGENLAPFITTVTGTSVSPVTTYSLDRFTIDGEFLQATFGYKNALFLTGAIRRDRSTVFSPSETNQTYPKISASWVVSDFDFWRNSGLGASISSLKLRSSLGASGGLSAIGAYDRFWQFSPTPFLGRSTIVPSSQLANPRVRPERMIEWEMGTDIGFWNNRASLSFNYYTQKIEDLTLNTSIAPSRGGSTLTDNVGSMENRGFEIMLSINPVNTKDFSWNTTLIYNQNRNKVLSAGSFLNAIPNETGAPVFYVEGQPASVFYGWYYARDANGNLLNTAQNLPQRERGTQAGTALEGTTVRDGNGQPSFGAGTTFLRKVIGDPNPDWTGSLVNELRYKNVTFNFMLDAVQGFEVFNADKRTRNNVGIGPLAEQEMLGTVPRGTIASLLNIEEFRVDNGSFVKLREISLGYDFGKVIPGVKSLSLSLIGRNLVSWDSYTGFDPETNAGGNGDRMRGVDFGNVPIPRSYQVRLMAKF